MKIKKFGWIIMMCTAIAMGGLMTACSSDDDNNNGGANGGSDNNGFVDAQFTEE